MYFQSNTSPSREVKDDNTANENNFLREAQFGHKTQYPATLKEKVGDFYFFFCGLISLSLIPRLEIKAFYCYSIKGLETHLLPGPQKHASFLPSEGLANRFQLAQNAL